MSFKLQPKRGEFAKIRRTMLKFEERISRKVNRSAMTKAGRPIAKEAKARVPKETGALRASISSQVKTLKDGEVVSRIGPRSGFKRDGRHPARYAHLVERGFTDPGGNRHPGSRFLEESGRKASDKASAAYAAGVKSALAREVAKL